MDFPYSYKFNHNFVIRQTHSQASFRKLPIQFYEWGAISDMFTFMKFPGRFRTGLKLNLYICNIIGFKNTVVYYKPAMKDTT